MSKSNIAAQIFFFSCDAPDTTETSNEIQRLAKIIDDVFSEQDVKWKVVNHSLNTDRLAALRKAGEKMAKQLRELRGSQYDIEIDDTALAEWEAANK